MTTINNLTRTKLADPHVNNVLRFLWVAVFITIIVVFYSNLPAYFQILRDSPTWGMGYEPILEQYSISRSAFAFYFTFIETLSFSSMVVFALLVFVIRNDDWMALLVAMTMLTVGSVATLNVHYTNNFFGSLFLGSSLWLMLTIVTLFPDGFFRPHFMKYIVVLYAPVCVYAAPLGSSLLGGGTLPPNQFTIVMLASGIPALGVAAQIYRYRRISTATERQQTKWILLGFLAWALGATTYAGIQLLFPSLRLPSLFPETTIYSLASLISIFVLVPLLLVSLNSIAYVFGLSILKYRLWNIDVVLNRGLVYAIQVIVLLIIFSFTFFSLQFLLTFFLGSYQNTLVGIISTALVVAAFNPIQRQIRHFVDRNLYGLRFDLNELDAVQHRGDHVNADDLTGQIIADYEVQYVMGKGGMGKVYKGFGNGQTVAIKTLLPEYADDEELHKRFMREAQIGLQLNHPTIVKVFAQGQHAGIPYFIMEHIDGQDLSRYLKQDGKLDEETAIRIMQDICTALDVAHGQGYVHRDLKPSNVMIRMNGAAVLMDFGITKVSNASTGLTGTGAIGTIDYMAPEQIIEARDVDHRADIYALGVILYEMMTGEKPFKGNAAQILFAHLQQPPPDPLDINPDIPAQIADAIEKAMAKDPDDRYQSAGKFAAALL